MIFVFIILGALGWSFTEYAMHNWRGHLGRGRNEFSRQHLKHHVESGYFTPLGHKILVTLTVGGSVTGISVLVLGMPLGFSFSAGFVGAYAGYEWLHWLLHAAAPTNAYGRWARKHHFHHHFHSAKMNHGVTSPLWDHVFGTYQEPGVIRVPNGYMMEWLKDPETGDVLEAYADAYQRR
jgi:sterol desaturase/sphingolipid hydroxylase (fatty acid hydroxylase superfamily)